MFFSYFSFLSFKKLLYCCVLSTSVRYVFLIFYRRRRKKRGRIFSHQNVSTSKWFDEFFFFSLFLAANSNRFVCSRLFLSISFLFFFPTAITIMIRLFCRFFQDYFSFFLLFLVGFWVIFLVFIRVFSVTITGFASF